MNDVAATTEARERSPAKSPGDLSSFWQVQLALADKEQQDWIQDGRAVVARYKNEKRSAVRNDGRRFNILYSNTETLKSALYGRTAKPDVRRRFADRDPVARQAADVVERALIDSAEVYDVDTCIEQALHDYLLPGRGVVRVEYEPVFGERPVVDPMTGQPLLGPDGEPEMERHIADQVVREKYVHWEDYRQSPARTDGDVWWRAYRHLMTRRDLRDNKFEDAGSIPLNWAPDTDSRQPVPDDLKRAEVWEIWDKRERERVWIVKGYDKPCRIDDDPYGLEDFWPQPAPLVSVSDTATTVPTPEFHTYRDQADDLDEITARISRLTRALKRRGVYDQAFQELKRLARAGDNEFIPVENYAALSTRGGLASAFQTEDIKTVAEVLQGLYAQRDMLIQGIYEVTGIADIMRGASDPNETLGAQKIKAQFGSTRMKRRQRAVQRWIRDLYKIKAELIAEHFEPEVLQQMTGTAVSPEVMQLLRSDKLRSYRIDIETDSTIFEDAEAEKAAVTEMLTSVGTIMEKGLPVVQQMPPLAPLIFEMLSIALRTLKPGRQLEDVVEQTKEEVARYAAQPRPDPEAQKAQTEMQMRREEHQMDMQGKQADLQVTQAKAGLQMQQLERRAAMQAMAQPGMVQ